jgi:hypothetical protein
LGDGTGDGDGDGDGLGVGDGDGESAATHFCNWLRKEKISLINLAISTLSAVIVALSVDNISSKVEIDGIEYFYYN